MSTESVRTEYVLRKLEKDENIMSVMTKEDMDKVKKYCHDRLPSKIEEASQVTDHINILLDEIAKQKLGHVQAIVDYLKNPVHDYVYKIINEILQKRKRLKRNKLKRLRGNRSTKN